MSTTMHTHSAPGSDDFREQLSAWHDGALPAEASRFVLKRLLDDENLRAEVGRWQAVGDALRRQPSQATAVSLAGRVGAAIARESIAEAMAAPRRAATSGPRAGWWATAAAVGLAAVLVLPGRDAPPAPLELAAAERPIDVPVSPIVRSVPMPLLAPQRASFEAEALVAGVPPLVRAPQPTAEQLAPLPALDAPSRPWPRSSGPQDAFTVDFAPPTGDASPRP